MTSTHETEGLPPGMTGVPVLMPVDQYAQLCVTAQRYGRDPALLLGWLIEIAVEAEGSTP